MKPEQVIRDALCVGGGPEYLTIIVLKTVQPACQVGRCVGDVRFDPEGGTDGGCRNFGNLS